MHAHPSQQEPVYSTDVGGQALEFYTDHVCFGQECLALEDIEGLLVIRTDTYVNGAWVSADRKVRLRAGAGVLDIDCGRFLPSRDELNSVFVAMMVPVMEIIAERLARGFFHALASGASLDVGGAHVRRDGVWVDGNWKFLWWQAKPRFVPWANVKIWTDEGKLYLGNL